MAFDVKALAEGRAVEVGDNADWELEPAFAVDAAEVVVVATSGWLVVWLLAGKIDHHDALLLQQQLDGAVDRRYAERGNLPARTLMNLVDGKRPRRVENRPENDIALLRLSLHLETSVSHGRQCLPMAHPGLRGTEKYSTCQSLVHVTRLTPDSLLDTVLYIDIVLSSRL